MDGGFRALVALLEEIMARILVADDNVSFRTALVRIIQSLGHTVVQASDGNEALRHLAAARVDLAITDVYMPDMDGIEFLLHLQEHHPEVPVVAMSGGGTAPGESVLEDARQLGARAVLQKPLTFEAVRQALRDHLPPTDEGHPSEEK